MTVTERRDYNRRYREVLIANGLCVRCKNVAVTRTLCLKHLMYERIRGRSYSLKRQKRPRPTPIPDTPWAIEQTKKLHEGGR